MQYPLLSSTSLSFPYSSSSPFFCFFLFLSSASNCGPQVGQSGPSTQSQLEYSSQKHALPSSAFLHLFRPINIADCARYITSHFRAIKKSDIYKQMTSG
ncbi:hypothetical protein CDV31_012404 [Fusarium ambrosium]|uniref:Uncharacterized protein n=1 Tax=Fusarium ambrosium TaxID=131363 RepID=A0A428TA39_9HYPO|nr:hypothetical protein CDV31_012404 [Fusarium ambrosium]